MKFSNIIRGTRAERVFEVPGYTIEATDGPKPFVVLFRPLTGLEHEAAHSGARARAIDKGVKDPALGDPIYDLALMAFVLSVGCVDPDSPPTARTNSFDSAEQILAEMHPEHIVHLHEHHEAWQDQCSPTTRGISEDKLIEAVREVAGPDGITTFMRFSPSTRLHFTISMARTLLPLLEAKSTPGSSSESNSPNSKNEQSAETDQDQDKNQPKETDQ